ncbi:PEP-CTERM sorting domain-containing protein [Bowmanella dokdonensis]|uniref:PEP-CTERM sorting domain-containing protein n=1 Tax=Bowmanella dokdonensis TaxID=751969 RepID=A0A939IQX9_9ALTE|nr:PEP-CTERM sorting domain-containing protein [Bowmanella dokdonensis]MBN7827400.1 PEP-CTERM sorting domain-containing protein [Bowmanella dokdonensis]
MTSGRLSHPKHYGPAAVLLLAGLCYSQFAAANIINQDFANAFDNWQGEVISYNAGSGTNSTASGDIFAAFSNNFSLGGNQVTLATSATGMDEFWSVLLYQDFVLDPSAGGAPLTLSLDVADNLTGDDDFFFAQLRNLDTNDVLDLSGGGSFDVSDWVGINASLEFGVQDGDFNLGDSLSISNIRLAEQVTEVPEPSSLLLLALGALLLLRRRA